MAGELRASADRRFARQLCAVLGVLFIAGGYAAAFTLVGAWMVFIGVGMLASAVLLWTRLPTLVGALAGPLVTVALLLHLWFEFRG